MEHAKVHLFGRQKLLLLYLMLSKETSSKLSLVKGIFATCNEILNKNIYDFHPYKFGPFSETLYLDLRLLEEKGFLKKDQKYVRLNNLPSDIRQRIVAEYTPEQIYKISQLAETYSSLSFEDLLEKIYNKYPYFSIKSTQKKFITKEAKRIDKALKKTESKIFSIGYEGTSIDEFLNKLIRSNVTMLVDIRNNPVSMKFGFSGKTLRRLCEERKIKYISIPELGIQSDIRKPLIEANDYEKLFLDFEKNHMPTTGKYLEGLKIHLEKRERMALLCFEACLEKCHRKIVTEHLYEYCEKIYELEHI